MKRIHPRFLQKRRCKPVKAKGFYDVNYRNLLIKLDMVVSITAPATHFLTPP